MQLGPFQLHERVGRGGMSTVWRAEHTGEGIEVAVKILTASRARQPRFLEGFRREVLAVAGLNHPGVITVHDYGWVDAEAEIQSDGQFLRDSPYLVMELMPDGTLDNWVGRMNWERLQNVLLLILDSLAHAHARGVVHRDIKPSNVLVDHLGSNFQIRLSDFGLAYAVPWSDLSDAMESPAESSEVRRVLGTPKFMAPEQIEGAIRDQGPWTDLYSLGCLAYCLATGHPPFVSGSKFDILRAHIYADPPDMNPVVPVPKAFERWVRKLLMKNPLDRYTRAADAAFALFGVRNEGLISGTKAKSGLVIEEDEPTLVHDVVGRAATLGTAEWAVGTTTSEIPQLLQGRAPIPPIPSTWRGHRPPTKRPLSGTGLGVFGVRSVPMVGRDSELDLLWNCLRISLNRRTPMAVVLCGGPGVGKTRIVREFVARSHEVGAARILNHQAGPEPEFVTSAAALVQGYIRAAGLDATGVFGRLRRAMSADLVDFKKENLLGQDDLLALARLLVPLSDGHVAVSSPVERHATIAQFFKWAAGPRPVVVWYDDAHWDGDAFEFARYMLQNIQIPMLFVFTVRDDLLDSGYVTSETVRDFCSLPSVESLDVGLLKSDYHEELVNLMLGLEPELARQVADRTGGNPLFAVQLVGDWVQRGVLLPGRDGFRLRAGENATIPDDIHLLWIRRIEQLASQYAGQFSAKDVSRALEVAAAFGGQVDAVEWGAACRDLKIPDDLVSRMHALQLADELARGWQFSHTMCRESIQRRAEDEGRWQTAHLRCVRALREVYSGSLRRGTAARIGTHLFQAGEHEEAIEPLVRAAREHYRSFERLQGNRFLSLAEEALNLAETPRTDDRWARTYFIRAKSLLDSGFTDEGRATLDEIKRMAKPLGWDVAVQMNMLLGVLSERAGRLQDSVRYFESARSEMILKPSRSEYSPELHQGIGVIYAAVGRVDEAYEAFEVAQREWKDLGLAHGQGAALLGMSQIHRGRNEKVEALRCLEEARMLFEEHGVRVGLSRVLNDLGDVRRDMGELEIAERHYRRSFEIMTSTGFSFVGVPALNLAYLLSARGEYQQALEASENARGLLSRQNLDLLASYVYPLQLVCIAELGEWGRWDEIYAQTLQVVNSGAVERDMADSLARSASACHRAGHTRWAMDAYHLAIAQFRTLGLDVRAQDIEDVVDLIGEETVTKP